MITIDKLLTLKKTTRLRKIVYVLQKCELDLHSGIEADQIFLKEVGKIVFEDEELPLYLRIKGYYLSSLEDSKPKKKTLIRLCNNLRHALLRYLNAEPSEWDLVVSESGTLDIRKRKTFPVKVFLEDIRSPYNVGSVFRTAESFGVEEILLTEDTPSPSHRKARRTSMGCTGILPWKMACIQDLEGHRGVFALELKGTPLEEFSFPGEGVVIIGSEELGVSPEALSIARKQHGIVSIPTGGAKASLNVSVAFGILMYRWFLYLLEKERGKRAI
ncbi:MAG: TrmH family RNA methyltransferase [Spirochaetes bacterium]|nr:MAG: TrmH family RNA methyltransferase [Spirochaetota bacterium]